MKKVFCRRTLGRAAAAITGFVFLSFGIRRKRKKPIPRIPVKPYNERDLWTPHDYAG